MDKFCDVVVSTGQHRYYCQEQDSWSGDGGRGEIRKTRMVTCGSGCGSSPHCKFCQQIHGALRMGGMEELGRDGGAARRRNEDA